MQDNTQSVVPKERIQKKPLSSRRCLHPSGLRVDANRVVVHCSLTFSGYSGCTSRSTVSEWRMNCNEGLGEFAVALPTASSSTGRFQMQQRRNRRSIWPMLIHLDGPFVQFRVLDVEG